MTAVPGDSSYPNFRLSNIIRANFSGGFFKKMQPREFGFEGLLRCPLRCVIETAFASLYLLAACRATLERLFFWILYKLCLDIPLRPLKDLEWHKGKKLRHHHRLSLLLLRELLATKPVVIFSRVRQTPLKQGVLCRFVRCCSFLLHAKLNLPLLLCPSGGVYAKSLSVRRIV